MHTKRNTFCAFSAWNDRKSSSWPFTARDRPINIAAPLIDYTSFFQRWSLVQLPCRMYIERAGLCARSWWMIALLGPPEMILFRCCDAALSLPWTCGRSWSELLFRARILFTLVLELRTRLMCWVNSTIAFPGGPMCQRQSVPLRRSCSHGDVPTGGDMRILTWSFHP